ncbi:MAG: PASTA domain-containing protein [Acutalibacteraceae bacterium]
MPYVIGKTGYEANRMILNAGFNIRIEGESIEHEGCVAVSQSIEAGENAAIGTVITVTFEVQGNALPD